MAIPEAPTVRAGGAPVVRERSAPTLGGLGELMVAVALLVMLASLAR